MFRYKNLSLPANFFSWAIIISFMLVGFVALPWINHNQRTEKTAHHKQYLTTARPLSDEAKITVDVAEKNSAVIIPADHWVSDKKIGPDNHTQTQLTLKQDGSFSVTVRAYDGGGDLLTETASGTYQIIGASLFFNVKDGAKGIFPTPGRIAIQSINSERLITFDGKDEQVFISKEGQEKLIKAQNEEKKSLLAKSYKEVPVDQRVEWLMGKDGGIWFYLFIGLLIAIVGIGKYFAARKTALRQAKKPHSK